MTGVRAAGLGVLAIAAGLLAIQIATIAAHPEWIRPVVAGDPAPPFELPRIGNDGRIATDTVSLASLNGHVAVLDFWATWCGPCRASMPALERLQRDYSGKGVRFLSINTEGPAQARPARIMASRLCPSIDLVSDDGRVGDLYKVDIIPHMVVVDRKGRVRLVHRGVPRGGAPALEADLRAVLDEVLAGS